MKSTADSAVKRIVEVRPAPSGHWVGDGFPVRSIFSYNDLGREVLSPFLFLDYAGPARFTAAQVARGVDEHPHRGFETVTISYQGGVEHRDSGGGGGKIGPGDVQWMTAASGVMHEEKHSRELTQQGGIFEMIQLWVNLPAKDKMSRPRYQTLLKQDIPLVPLSGAAGQVRVLAGEYGGKRGPAKTFSPINLWDIELKAGAGAVFDLPEDHTAAFFVRQGRVDFNGAKEAGTAELAVLSRSGTRVVVTAKEDSGLLFLGGQPLREPVVGYGPFVMNTMKEIQEAIADVQAGRFGSLAPSPSS